MYREMNKQDKAAKKTGTVPDYQRTGQITLSDGRACHGGEYGTRDSANKSSQKNNKSCQGDGKSAK